jgi:ribosome-associated protein
MEARATTQPADYARLAVDVASDKQASDIVMLDIRGVCDFTDYFVILTADSTRQLDSVAVDIEQALKGEGASLHHREGGAQSGWALLDFGDVIVHLFRAGERDFYHIEGAWSGGIETVRVQ